jgi:hypothetical protein
VIAEDEYSRTAVYYTASKGFRLFCKALLERSAKQSDFEDGWKPYKKNRTKGGERKNRRALHQGTQKTGILILLGIS